MLRDQDLRRNGGSAALRRRLDELVNELAVLAPDAQVNEWSRDRYERVFTEFNAVARALRSTHPVGTETSWNCTTGARRVKDAAVSLD